MTNMHKFLTPGGMVLVNLSLVTYAKELSAQTFRYTFNDMGQIGEDAVHGPAVMLHFGSDRLTVNSTLDQIEQLSRSSE